jgi:hypothetical protein
MQPVLQNQARNHVQLSLEDHIDHAIDSAIETVKKANTLCKRHFDKILTLAGAVSAYHYPYITGASLLWTALKGKEERETDKNALTVVLLLAASCIHPRLGACSAGWLFGRKARHWHEEGAIILAKHERRKSDDFQKLLSELKKKRQ